MRKRFVAIIEDRPGREWLARFVAGRAEAESWYRGHGMEPPPSAEASRAALRAHMPELLPLYDQACALVGDDDLAHRMISHYRPPPVSHGCSQAVWLGEGGPALIRNYDFPLDIVSDHFVCSRWFGREVIAKAQRPWGGCLDGMNADGLVASLTAGGGRTQGLGFSIILVLRYVLETCSKVAQAIATLKRLPIAQSQNVTLLDRTGAHATLFLGPGREPAVSTVRTCTNHQELPDVPDTPAGRGSLDRQRHLQAALEEPGQTLAGMAARFFEPPLYSRRRGFTTVYTAIYRPERGSVEYRWPGMSWVQRIGGFRPGDYLHDYGELIPQRGHGGCGSG